MTAPIKAKQSSLSASVKDQSGAGKMRIGDMLRKQGYITSKQLDDALAFQKKHQDRRLGSILVQLGYIDEDTILNFLSRLHNYPAVDIKKENPTPEALKLMPYEMAKRYMAFPLRIKGNTVFLTMAEPTDTAMVEGLQTELKRGISVAVSTERNLVEAYKKHYEISDEEYDSLLGVDKATEDDDLPVTHIDDFGALASEASEGYELAGDEDDDVGADSYSASDAPIIKLVNGILIKAVNDGVSDIHIEPYEKNLQVRYRLDGSLYKSMNLPLNIKNALVSRIKILANLDITERRVPQDGRIKMKLSRNRAIDFSSPIISVVCLPCDSDVTVMTSS